MCQCQGCGPCHARRLSGMTPAHAVASPDRERADYPTTFPSRLQGRMADAQPVRSDVPHQPTATKTRQVPFPAIGGGSAKDESNRTWEVGHSNWGTHAGLKWGTFINAPRARFRRVLDLLPFRGDLTPQWSADTRVRRRNHAALDEPSYNLGEVTGAQIAALARARAKARQG